MKILAIALSLAFLFTASAAFAAKPAVQACLGHDISAEASALGSDFGQTASATAKALGGLGPLVQDYLAGNIPDGVEPNTCND